MFLNYLKLSLRQLVGNPFFSSINIVGLAIGFAAFYTLWEFSISELKADQYHKDYDRIARIGLNWRWTDDGGKTWGHIKGGAQPVYLPGPALIDNPDIEASVQIMNQPQFTESKIGHGNQVIILIQNSQNQHNVFKEEKAVYASANLFSFFSIPLIYGQPDRVLNEAGFVVLSHSTAVKYFGEKDPTGELLRLNDIFTLKVSGVYADLPHNTH